MEKVMGIYCRISRLKEEGKDRSINDQKELGIAKAKELGFKYELYVDEGISAASDDIEKRPEFKRLIEDATQGKLYAIFGYDQSRFERNPQIHYLFVSEVKKHITEYYTHVDGLVDLNDPQIELMSNIMSVFNQYHVTMTKHKVKSVLKRNAKEGKAQGLPPYGYTKDEKGYLMIDPEEAKVIKKIYDMSLSGYGTRAIANQLNDEGVPTRYNKIGKGTLTTKNRYTGKARTIKKSDIKWAQNTIRSILRNSLYKGERIYNGEIIPIDFIITPSKWQKVQDNLPQRARTSNTKYQYLLKGLIRCGKCGRNYYGRTRQDKRDHTYICSSRRIKDGNCGNRGINIDRLDEFIWYRIINSSLFLKLLRKDFSFDDKQMNELKEQIEGKNKLLQKLEENRKRLVSALANGVITEDDLQIQLGELTKKGNSTKSDVEVLEFKLENLNNADKIISGYEKFQKKLNFYRDSLSFEEKQTLVYRFIDNIVVLYNEQEEVYEINIYFSIHPSDFDDEYPLEVKIDERAYMPRKEPKYYDSVTKSTVTSETV